LTHDFWLRLTAPVWVLELILTATEYVCKNFLKAPFGSDMLPGNPTLGTQTQEATA
jgi:hypothetical protein